jgi:hypothetical protein
MERSSLRSPREVLEQIHAVNIFSFSFDAKTVRLDDYASEKVFVANSWMYNEPVQDSQDYREGSQHRCYLKAALLLA